MRRGEAGRDVAVMQGQTGRDDTRRDEGRAGMRWCVRLGELGWAKTRDAGRVVGVGSACGGVWWGTAG